MAGKTRELKVRMKAVGNIQRITKTMQMIATARFQKMQKRATQAKDYSDKLAEVVGELTAAAKSSGEVDHPLLAPPSPPTGKTLVLAITASRGFAGGYNNGVVQQSLAMVRGDETDVTLHVVGKKGLNMFKFSRVKPDAFHEQFGESPEYADVEALAERYIEAFVSGEYDAIKVVSVRFISMSKQVAQTTTLLPMEPPEAAEASATTSTASGTNIIYEFRPDANALLAELLPRTVKTRLFQLFNEAVVSEQLARMVAMKAATDAAGTMKKDLGRRYNRARQAAITTELTEIISGAAALG